MASNKNSISVFYCALLYVGSLFLLVNGQDPSGSGAANSIMSVPAGILASSADGMARYLANDGPIQPAITAIGGLPIRAAEYANGGIGRMSRGFENGAQSLSRSAGQNGNIRMPGMEALESNMPASLARLGSMAGNAISSKNNFIRGQAERGVQAADRLMSRMQQGTSQMMAKSSGHMVGTANMLSSAPEALQRGASQIQNQLRQSLQGTMSRLDSVRGMGGEMRNQAQGIAQTLQSGLTGAASQLQRTGEQVINQIQGGMRKNANSMAGVMGSMQGSMGDMGQNLQRNLQGALSQAQRAASQVQGHIQQAAAGPINMLQNLGSGLGNMMQGGGSSGRY